MQLCIMPVISSRSNDNDYMYAVYTHCILITSIKRHLNTVVFQPPFYQYNQGLPLVVSACNVQNRTRPARRSLDEVIRPSSRRVVTV